MSATKPFLEQRLQAEPPAAPNSDPPTINQLRQRVDRHRRSRRRLLAGSVLSVFVMVAGYCVVPEKVDPAGDSKSSAVANRLSPASQSEQRQTSPTIPLDRPEYEFSVFARMTNRLPVFGVHAETNRLQHVGWLESESVLPVDFRSLSIEQQEEFKAALDPEPVLISL